MTRRGQGRCSATGAVVAALVGLVALAGCTDGGSASDDAALSEDRVAEPARECTADDLADDRIVSLTGDDPVEVASAVAATHFTCADVAVVAPGDDRWATILAAPVALAADGPLLLAQADASDGPASAASSLEPAEVVTVGFPTGSTGDGGAAGRGEGEGDEEDGGDGDGGESGSGDAPDDVEVTALTVADAGGDSDTDATGEAEADTDAADETDADTNTDTTEADAGAGSEEPLPAPTALGLVVLEHLGADCAIAVPVDDPGAGVAAAAHLEEGCAIVPVPVDPALLAETGSQLPSDLSVEVVASDPERAKAVADGLGQADVEATVAEAPLWPEEPAPTAWLVDPAHTTAAAVGVVAAHRDEVVLPVNGNDLRSDRVATNRLRAAEAEQLVLTGDLTSHAGWQLRTVVDGPPLPTGGFRLFEDDRMVALYGHPGAPGLGALGAQGLDATVERARAVAAPYGADGREVVPAFEIIATVASSGAGPLGDYSSRTPVEELRPWVDRARDEGFYVVLDLQPGRGDFLTQARDYEELLLEPHVGLAIDPEWRLEPHQLHMRQIGWVGAGEVQAVADWLAELTRSNHLPEKLLVLHQFRHSMLPDRDTIVAPPELAVVVHMDGHGPQSVKDGSYDAITAGVEDRWLWGWKNFFERDFPTASPERVLALDPRPVFVSYQ